MKAAVYYQAGGPEVFRYEDVPDPEPAPDGVLVRIEAISIEGGDTLHRASSEVTGGPDVVGYQAAGTVLAVGERAAGFQPDQRVVTVGLDGSHTELRAVPEQFCWTIPGALSTDEAACVPVATMPGWLQAFAKANPITVITGALRALCLGGPTIRPAVEAAAWIAALLAVTVPAAARYSHATST